MTTWPNKMLRGSGDFSPADPDECPEDCPYYAPEDLAYGYCHSHKGCIYAPPHPDDVADRKK